MKKLLLGMAAIVVSVIPCHADTSGLALNSTIANNSNTPVVTTTSTYLIDMNAVGADAISVEVSVSSANPQTQTFKDGTPSTGIITVVTNTALAAQVAVDTLTVTTDSALVAAQGFAIIDVSTASQLATGGIIGSTFTVAGSSVVGGLNYTVGATTNTTAANIVAYINAHIPNVTAAVSPVNGGSVTITCINAGSFCNSYSITTSTPAALGVTAFSGGLNNPSFTIADPIHTWIFPQGLTWTTDVTYSSNTAVSIANAINAGTTYVTASTSTSTTVLIQTIKAQPNANLFTLSSSTPALTVSSGNFTGGQGNAYLVIDGRILTAGNQWAVGTTAALTATNIAAAINADSILSTIMVSTAPNGASVIYATGTIITTASPGYTSVGNNYTWQTSTAAALSISNSGLYGGTTAAWVINQATITIPSHGLATGEEVLFTSGTIAIAPLINQTSYYVIAVDANDIELALTSTGSLAGAYITLTSTSTAGPHTFTLTPLALAGSEVFTWQTSNDGVNFSSPTVTATNVTIPTNAFATPYTGITYGYDFGNVNYRYLRLTATGPNAAGAGGYNTTVFAYGKRYWR